MTDVIGSKGAAKVFLDLIDVKLRVAVRAHGILVLSVELRVFWFWGFQGFIFWGSQFVELRNLFKDF